MLISDSGEVFADKSRTEHVEIGTEHSNSGYICLNINHNDSSLTQAVKVGLSLRQAVSACEYMYKEHFEPNTGSVMRRFHTAPQLG